VGFFDKPAFLKIAEWAASQDSGPAHGVTTPWSPGNNMERVVLSDIFGEIADDPAAPVSREMAMRQPAVIRARGVLITLARYPLTAWRGTTKLKSQPRWLHRTDTPVSPQERMTDTMDDIIFHKYALWIVTRAEAEPGKLGQILDAMRWPKDLWRWTTDGGIEIQTGDATWSEPLPKGSYLVFKSFQDAFLTSGATVVRTGDGIQRAIAGRAKSPIPGIDLHLTEAMGLTTPEKEALRAAWVKARNSPDGAVAITPHNIEAKVLGTDASEFLDQARNSQRIDTANALQVPASLLDGTTSTASLTYSTQEGRRVEFHDYGLNLWRTVIESRLSMDDATPSGTRIEIDLSELLQLPDEGNGPALED
jgi:hypothetical protein